MNAMGTAGNLPPWQDAAKLYKESKYGCMILGAKVSTNPLGHSATSSLVIFCEVFSTQKSCGVARIGHDESCGLTFLNALHAALESGFSCAETLVPQAAANIPKLKSIFFGKTPRWLATTTPTRIN